MTRFPEDEHPIHEMAAEFTVVLDRIEDLQAGPYTLNITSPVRLHCRVGRIRIHIEDMEVQEYARHRDWASKDTRPQWRTVNGHDQLAWLITDLIRTRYDTQKGQAWLRAAASPDVKEDDDNGGGD